MLLKVTYDPTKLTPKKIKREVRYWLKADGVTGVEEIKQPKEGASG